MVAGAVRLRDQQGYPDTPVVVHRGFENDAMIAKHVPMIGGKDHDRIVE